MFWILIPVAGLLLIGIIYTRDNILAAIALTFLGVAVALGVWALYPNASILFVLVILIYIVAALTLVIIAASSLSEENKAVQLRPVAFSSLGVLPLALLPGLAVKSSTAQLEIDAWALPLSAALLIFAFVIAARVSHD